jgi:hypothetical protein
MPLFSMAVNTKQLQRGADPWVIYSFDNGVLSHVGWCGENTSWV